MNLKNIKALRKPILFLGASLCGLMLLQTGHEVVKALDLSIVSPESIVSPASSAASESSESALPTEPAVPPLSATPALGRQQSAPESASSGSATENSAPSAAQANNQENPSRQPSPSRRQLLAINAGAAGEAQQPVSQISPDQIATSATNQWYGASFPVEQFQAYTSPFGYRQAPDGGYSTEFHYGLDMAAPEGSYIRNWWTGKVVEVSDDSNCGTSVVVESGEWTHIYCHMQGHVEEEDKGRYMVDREGGIQIWEGQDIAAGARMGRVGMTGRTTGPHLHWGLKFDANWVDPALVLRAMYVSQQQAASRPADDKPQ